MIQHNCKNCVNLFSGKFCNNCGQKVYAEKDKSVRHFFDETFHFFTHLDNKFLRTLYLIFRRPGHLSLSYCDGIRNRYYKPLSLFFIGVILYLLFPFLPGLNLAFLSNMVNFKAQGMTLISDMAINKAAAKSISLKQLAEIYDSRSANYAKVLLLVIIPFTAIALKLLFFRKRRYYFDHLILATEASSVTLYLIFFILPFILFINGQVFRILNLKDAVRSGDLVTMNVIALFLLIWSTAAFIKFYKLSFLHAFLKGILFLFLHYIVIYIIYRLILFLIVLLFI